MVTIYVEITVGNLILEFSVGTTRGGKMNVYLEWSVGAAISRSLDCFSNMSSRFGNPSGFFLNDIFRLNLGWDVFA